MASERTSEQTSDVDVVVVGLGPGGEAVATELVKAGLHVAAVDQHLVGGECPYYGCVPSKMMIRAANALAEGSRIHDLAGRSEVQPDWTLVAKRIAEEATDHWNDQVAVERLQDAGVRFVRGHARLAGARVIEVGDTQLRARRGVVLNTGTTPAVPPIDGLEGTPFWTNRDAVQVTDLPASLGVIGGGAIGVELAQAFSRFGVQVTIVEMADRLVAVEEPEASAVLADVFAREGIQVLTGAGISSVGYGDGTFTVHVDEHALEVDKLLVAAGRYPNLSDIGLESLGLDPRSRSLDTDAGMQVLDGDGHPVEGLWAIGDITGKGAFTHMSMYQSAIAARAILGREGPRAAYHAVPRVTFTDPEVGAVGLTEQQARDAGHSVRVGRADVSTSARGWIHQAGNDGFIKLVEDSDRGVLVGATSMGPVGGEVLSALAVAVHTEATTASLRSMIYAYPTFHRGIEDALRDLG